MLFSNEFFASLWETSASREEPSWIIHEKRLGHRRQSLCCLEPKNASWRHWGTPSIFSEKESFIYLWSLEFRSWLRPRAVIRNFVFTSENLSLFRVLSPSSTFSCTTIASLFAYFKCSVSYCCSRENETWRQYLEQWQAFTCNDETFDKKLTNCSPILLPYNISIIVKLKGHIKGRLISRI